MSSFGRGTRASDLSPARCICAAHSHQGQAPAQQERAISARVNNEASRPESKVLAGVIGARHVAVRAPRDEEADQPVQEACMTRARAQVSSKTQQTQRWD